MTADAAGKNIGGDTIPSSGSEDRSKTEEVSNETSYGVMGSATAREFGDEHDRPSVLFQEDKKNCQVGPETAGTRDVRQPRKDSEVGWMTVDHTNFFDVASSTASSMPDPTNREPCAPRPHYNQPVRDVGFPKQTSFTKGVPLSAVCNSEIHGNTEGDTFFSCSPVDLGYSGSVQATIGVRTPPNGQGDDH